MSASERTVSPRSISEEMECSITVIEQCLRDHVFSEEDFFIKNNKIRFYESRKELIRAKIEWMNRSGNPGDQIS